MVSSSALTIIVDDERLMCGGFSFGETVRLGSFEFIVDYFSGLSFPTWRSNSGAALWAQPTMGHHPRAPAMIEDSIEEFHMASRGEADVVQGLYLLQSQPHHGWRMLQPPTP
jgi:hypothetical protein